jgi:hypothetical protein
VLGKVAEEGERAVHLVPILVVLLKRLSGVVAREELGEGVCKKRRIELRDLEIRQSARILSVCAH